MPLNLLEYLYMQIYRTHVLLVTVFILYLYTKLFNYRF